MHTVSLVCIILKYFKIEIFSKTYLLSSKICTFHTFSAQDIKTYTSLVSTLTTRTTFLPASDEVPIFLWHVFAMYGLGDTPFYKLIHPQNNESDII